MKKVYLMTLVMLVSFAYSFGQGKIVKGKVTDKTGSPMPGVSVLVQGTTTATATNEKGEFEITVPSTEAETGKKPKLVFSFIGLKTVTLDYDADFSNLVMEDDATQLSEVVITAQGIEKSRNELAYSAQEVKGEEVSRTRDNNFINGLSGKVSGLQITRSNGIGASTNVVLRGIKSIDGNNQALFVVDNVPMDNSNTNTSDQKQGGGGYDFGNAAADINPDDIETISVLKGAAATALYGSRAANGVVLITTKKSASKGLGITINTGVNIDMVDKSTLPTYQKEYGAGYIDAFRVDPITGNRIVVRTLDDASFGPKFDPTKNVLQWDAYTPYSSNYGKATPWVGAANDPTTFFKTGVSTNNNIEITNGFEKGFFKAGYTRNSTSGVMPNSNLTKDMFNFSASYKVNDKLSVSASANVTNIDGLGRPATGYSSNTAPANLMTNFRQWWETNVDVKAQEDVFNKSGGQNISWNMNNPRLGDTSPLFWDNPYFVRYKSYENDNRFRTFGNARADYKFTDWFSLAGWVSVDSYNEKQEERIAKGSVQPSRYSKYLRSYQEYNYNLLANFNKDISKNVTLKGVLGANVRTQTIESTYSYTNGGLVVADLYSLNNSVSPVSPASEIYTNQQVNGYFGNASVGFYKTLFLDASLRVDQSSTLPLKNNTYPYGSLAAGFVFYELVKDKLPWLSSGKIRANYAVVGNSAPPAVLTDVYNKPVDINNNPINNFGSSTMFSVQGTKYNPNLLPELTRSVELGLEASFLGGRVGVDATFYTTNSYNQILTLPVTRATGYNYEYINGGNIQNQGLELLLKGSPVKTRQFSWDITVNWTRNRSEVIKLTDNPNLNVTNYQLGSFQNGITINATEGQPYGTIQGTDYVYDAKGRKLIDDNGQYLSTSTTSNVLGNIQPNWYGGIQNTFKFKGFALGFLIDVKSGGSIYSLDMAYGMSTGILPDATGNNSLGVPIRDTQLDANGNVINNGGMVLDGVHADGSVNTTRVDPRNTYENLLIPNKAYVYDASYVKLREVFITYSIPAKLISAMKVFKGIDVSLTGRNLWIIYKNLPYSDPEDQISSGNLNGGYQTGANPLTRNMGFNVKFKF